MKTSTVVRLFTLFCGALFACAGPAPAQSFRPINPDTPAPARIAGFGAAVAIGDGAVFIGEPTNLLRSGVVYVHREGADGAWHEVAQITASDAHESDGFGTSIAVNDNILVIGATGQNEGRGAAYVFRLEGGTWREVARLTPDDGEAGDDFGASIALDGDLVLIGAPAHAEQIGAVYAFRRDAPGSWTAAGKIMASDSMAGGGFGAAIGLERGLALIGAPGPAESTGAVYSFGVAGDEWREVGMVEVEGLEPGSRFGAALDMRAGRALIGAPGWAQATGTVFVFRPAGSGVWEPAGRLQADGAAPRHLFGSSIAPADDGVWVGAPGADGFRGAVYVFESGADEGEWVMANTLTPEETVQGGAAFGASIAVQGGVAVVGVTRADQGAGRAVIFEPGDEADAWVPRITLLSEPEALEPIVGGVVACQGGEAAMFGCSGIDLLSFLPIPAIGGNRGTQLNDIWGWADPETGKQYALVGRTDGAAFVDISDPVNPIYVGELPRTPGSPPAAWRDVKTYENYAYVVADASEEHGVQVFDLTRLREYAGEPITFEADTIYDRVASAHNIVINTETGFAYAVGVGGGGETCGGGLHMINIQDPANPAFAGCFADPQTGRAGTGYTHDGQCVVYEGPDEDYQGQEICFGYNETAISIADVTDKDNPVAITRVSYPDVAYTHQGWLTEDHRYVLMNDELDEISGSTERTRTLIWDVSDLDDPQLVTQYMGETGAIDHNLYIRDGLAFESNYASGLRILDIEDPASPVEIAYFDVAPFSDNDVAAFTGSWSNYPFFENGVIPVSSIEYGLFLVRMAEPVAR